MKNIFTIDTEDWFHANYEDDLFRNDAAVKSTVEENTEVYLEALERNHATATFFVLGFVAEQHPGLVQKIAQAGHEVASHGYGHQLYTSRHRRNSDRISSAAKSCWRILLESRSGVTGRRPGPLRRNPCGH